MSLEFAIGRQTVAATYSLKVLVVDDVSSHQRLGRCVFEALDCRVWVAADGLQAVDMASAMDFDLILMDRNMPGCDGDTATRLIRAVKGKADCPMIISHSSEPPTGKASAIYDAVIPKPLRIVDVLDYVIPRAPKAAGLRRAA